jgi:hypothetical protein
VNIQTFQVNALVSSNQVGKSLTTDAAAVAVRGSLRHEEVYEVRAGIDVVGVYALISAPSPYPWLPLG